VCTPNDYCYNGLNLTCPPKSQSGPGMSDYMQCSCNAGFMNATIQTVDTLCQDCPADSYCTGGGRVEACTANAFSPTQTANSSSCTCNLGYAGVRNAPCVPCAAPSVYCYGGLVATCPAGTQSGNLAWTITNCTCTAGRYGVAGESRRLLVYYSCNGTWACLRASQAVIVKIRPRVMVGARWRVRG